MPSKPDQKPAVTDAQKEIKFKELASRRMDRLLKGIESLSKLSAISRYKYSPQQIEKMERSFSDALNRCFSLYKGSKQAKTGFLF